MKLLLRVDGNPKIGFGHVISSILFAKGMNQKTGCELIISTKDKSCANLFLERMEHTPLTVISDKLDEISKIKADIIFCDLLEITKDYLNLLRKTGAYLIVRDSLCSNPEILADMIINRNVVKKWTNYKRQNKTTYLIGPQYELLDSAYTNKHTKTKVIRQKVKKILISCGSSGSLTFFSELQKELTKYNTTLILSFAHTKISGALHNISSKKHAELLFENDLVICSASKTLYEATCVGTPALTIAFNPHQEETAESFEKLGCAINLGAFSDFKLSHLTLKITQLDQKTRLKISEAQKTLLNGDGFENIYQELEPHLHRLNFL